MLHWLVQRLKLSCASWIGSLLATSLRQSSSQPLYTRYFSSKKSLNFSANYLPGLWMDLDEIWHAFEMCWSDQFHITLILADQYTRESIQSRFLVKNNFFNIGIHSNIYWIVSFKLGETTDTTKLYTDLHFVDVSLRLGHQSCDSAWHSLILHFQPQKFCIFSLWNSAFSSMVVVFHRSRMLEKRL